MVRKSKKNKKMKIKIMAKITMKKMKRVHVKTFAVSFKHSSSKLL